MATKINLPETKNNSQHEFAVGDYAIITHKDMAVNHLLQFIQQGAALCISVNPASGTWSFRGCTVEEVVCSIKRCGYTITPVDVEINVTYKI